MKPEFSLASPRPWTIGATASHHPKLFDANDQPICSVHAKNSYLAEAAEAENAALIVHAVNCHEELVAALGELREWTLALEPFDNREEPDWPELAARIDAALAKARGE